MEKIPDMINSEGSSLKELESKGRKEILEHIKAERSKRDTVLKKASSFGVRIKDILGAHESRDLKHEAKHIQDTLHHRVAIKHDELDYELERESQKIIKQTIKDPLKKINEIYHQKEEAKRSGDQNADELLQKEKEFISSFKFENILTAFGERETRKAITGNLKDFLNSDAIYENILDDSGNKAYGLDGNTKGFPIEVARTVLEGVCNTIENDGVSVLEDDPSLFMLLERSIYLYRKSLSGNQKEKLLALMLDKGINLDIFHLAKLNRLIDYLCADSIEFTEKLKSKVDNLFISKSWNAISSACQSPSKILSNIALTKLDGYLQQYNIPLDSFKKVWGLFQGATWEPFSGDLGENMNKIEVIENQRPGITKSLFDNFGIKEFRRYPENVLIKQFDTKDEHIPYGVVVYTNSDHNQAFDMDSKTIESIFNQTSQGNVGMRIVEFKSRYELFKRLASLNSKYGDQNKIQYLLLGAHGSEQSFSVSSFKKVTKDDFEGIGIKRIRDFFVEKPEIIMASCSTGVKDGIAQKISETYEAIVHAPTKPTTVESVDVVFENKRPHFTVKYRDDVRNTFHAGSL